MACGSRNACGVDWCRRAPHPMLRNASPRGLDAPATNFDERIRGKLISGARPLESPKAMWGGYGTRRLCAVCETTIREAEVEYELDMPGGQRLFMHMGCHSAWMTERIRLGFV